MRHDVARSAHSRSVSYNWFVFRKLDHEQKTTGMFIQDKSMSEITNGSTINIKHDASYIGVLAQLHKRQFHINQRKTWPTTTTIIQ